MEKRISQREIAKIAGVHHTTVSMALRGHPALSAAMRERIRKLADELGYTPDPMLRALSAYRQERRTPSFRGVLAWINAWQGDHDSPDIFRTGAFALLKREALARCADHGYQLEEFALGGKKSLSAARLSTVLHERGIHGLIIPPLPGGRARLSLRWEWFSSVAIGFSLVRPALHTFAHDHYQNVGLLTRHLRRLGCRRLGLVSHLHEQKRTDGLRTAAFVMLQRTQPQNHSIPPFIPDQPDDDAGLAAWVHTHRPDAILVRDTGRTIEVLRGMGLRVPEDIVVAGFNLDERGELPGIIEDHAALADRAVDFLAGTLARGELGLPEKALHTHVLGDWFPGTLAHRDPALAKPHPLAAGGSRPNARILAGN